MKFIDGRSPKAYSENVDATSAPASASTTQSLKSSPNRRDRSTA